MFKISQHTGFIPLKEEKPTNKFVYDVATTNEQLVVPQGYRNAILKLWGAGGGGGGGGDTSPGGNGGAGGYIEGIITVVPGEALTIRVGGAGEAGQPDRAGNGGVNGGGQGGDDAPTTGNVCAGGAGGGGYSGIFRKNSTIPLIIAGAGGGGGAGDGGSPGNPVDTGGNGGAGGGLQGDSGRTGITITNITNNEALNLEYYNLGLGESANTVDDIENWTGGFLTGQTNTLDLTTITTNLGVEDEQYGLILTGIIYLSNPGGTTDFTLTSDDGSKLFINDELVIDNDGLQAPTTASGSIVLESCIHNITIKFFENTGGSVLSCQIRLPGETVYSDLLSIGRVAPSVSDLDSQLFEAGGGTQSTGGTAIIGPNQNIQPTSGGYLSGGTGGTGVPSERPGGGGGGAGYYGGAGGIAAGAIDSSGSAGGGGSSYCIGKIIKNEKGKGRIPSNTDDLDYNGTAGRGGTGGLLSVSPGSAGTNGTDGLVIVEFF